MILVLAAAVYAATIWLWCALEDAWRDTNRIDRAVGRAQAAPLDHDCTPSQAPRPPRVEPRHRVGAPPAPARKN